MLRTIRLQCVGVWILTGLHCIYIYIYLTMCILFSDLRWIFWNVTVAKEGGSVCIGYSRKCTGGGGKTTVGRYSCRYMGLLPMTSM
jgi:hypothetical protein